MQLKITTGYAIRVFFCLATTKKITSSKELSDKLDIPQSTIFKIGKKLSNKGIISITSGIQGGFLLKKKPQDISLFEIVSIFEPTIKVHRCLEEGEYCKSFVMQDCPVRKVYCKIQQLFENELKNTSIKDLI